MQDAVGTVFYTDVVVENEDNDIYCAIINSVNYDVLHKKAVCENKTICEFFDTNDVFKYNLSEFDVIDIFCSPTVHELYVQDCERNMELLNMIHSLEHTICLDNTLYNKKEKEWRAVLWNNQHIVTNFLKSLPSDITDACEKLATCYTKLKDQGNMLSFFPLNESISTHVVLRAIAHDMEIRAEQLAGKEIVPDTVVTKIRERINKYFVF